MIGGHRFDPFAIWRQEDHRTEVTRRIGDVLGDDAQEGFDVRNGVAEGARRFCDRGQPLGVTATQGGGVGPGR